MNIVSAATRAVAKTADVTTAAAGAIGGAAVSGTVGGLQGAATGVRAGLDNGSRSSAAAALTLGAVGAAGLVEWPVLLAVGGAALVVHQLNRRANSTTGDGSPLLAQAPTAADRQAGNRTARPAKASARKAAKSTTRNSSRSAKKTTAPRRSAAT
jgi:hypothetical protein